MALMGLAIAVLSLVSSSGLRLAVLDYQRPFGLLLCFYSLFGLKSCGVPPAVPLGYFSLTAASGFLVKCWTGRTLVSSVLGTTLPPLSTLGYLFCTLAPLGQIVSSTLHRVQPNAMNFHQEARLERFAEAFGQHDIVCVQELTVWCGFDGYVRDLGRRAEAKGLRFFVRGSRWPTWPATFCSTGLAIFSAWPVVRSEAISFSRQAWFEWYIIQRGAVMAILERPSDRALVAVLNLHTTSGLEVLETGVGSASAPTRANPQASAQLEEALRRFAAFSEGAAHRVVCGDFNVTKDSAAFRAWSSLAEESLGLQDCYPSSPPTFGCVDARTGAPTERLLTKPACRGKPKVLDHVFSDVLCDASSVHVDALAAPEAESEHWQQASDHRAVAVAWT